MLASNSLFRIENKESRLLSYREYSPNRQKVFETIGFTQERIRCLDRSAAVIEHSGCINTARWHSNGVGLLTGGDDRFVKYWNLTSDFDEVELQHAQLTRHRGNIFCADFSAIDNNIIISAAADGSVRSSSLLNHNVGTTLRSSDDIIHMFHIDQDQSYVIYTAEEAGSIYRIDLRTAKTELLFRHIGSAYTNSPAWNNEKYGNIMSTVSSSPAPVKSIIQHPTFSAPHLIVGGRGYIVSLLDLRLTNHHHSDDTAAVSAFSKFWSPMFPVNTRTKDNQKIAAIEQTVSGSHPYAQREEDTDYTQFIRKHNARQVMNEVSVSGLDISKDGNRILANFQHDQIYTFNFHNDEGKTCTGVTAMIGGHINYATFLKTVRFFGPHDEYVAAGCDSGNVWIWESQHRYCPGISQDANDVYVCPVVNVLKADDRTCNGCIPHPYEPFLLSYGIDDTAKLWGFSGRDYHEEEQSDEESSEAQSCDVYHRCRYIGSSTSSSTRNFQRYSLPLSGYNRCLSPYSLIYALPELLEANLVEAGITLPKVFELTDYPASRCVMNPWDFKNTANKLRWWQYCNHVLLPMRKKNSLDGPGKELFDRDDGAFMPSDHLNSLLTLDMFDKSFVTNVSQHMATIICDKDNSEDMLTACILLADRMKWINYYRDDFRKAKGIDSYVYVHTSKMNKRRDQLFNYLFLPLVELSRLAEVYKTLGNVAFKSKKYDVAHFFYCKAQRYIEYILQLRLIESKILEGDRKLLTAAIEGGGSGNGTRSRWQRSDPISDLQPLYNPSSFNNGDRESEVTADDDSFESAICEDALTYRQQYDEMTPQLKIKYHIILKLKLFRLLKFLERRNAPAGSNTNNNASEQNAVNDSTKEGNDAQVNETQDEEAEEGEEDEAEVIFPELTTEEDAYMNEITSPAYAQRLKEHAFVIMQTIYNQYLPELMLSVMSNLAAVFMAMEKYQEAIYVCSDALTFAERVSQPVDAKIYFRRGSAAINLHCYEDAVADLTQASALCPQDKAIANKLKDARRLTEAKRKREMKVYSKMFS